MAATFLHFKASHSVIKFQSPIHRVNGCNYAYCDVMAERIAVSVPYSSGQWLQPTIPTLMPLVWVGFSPLFIGSMAATGRRERPPDQTGSFQSPIHRVNGCNIPSTVFTKGNWTGFSPLFIGSMAATMAPSTDPRPSHMFQSPIHRVNGCNQEICRRMGPHLRVSVPYSSGQWLQRRGCTGGMECHYAFQSPIHRVNGCNLVGGAGPEDAKDVFQSPIHRVNGCNKKGSHSMKKVLDGFSPLFIGSMAATQTLEKMRG